MKVGIVTIHHTTNYGAVMQAWALRQAVERLGHQALVMDYRPLSAVRYFRKQNTHNLIALIKYLKDWRFARFRASSLPTTPRVQDSQQLAAQAESFDALIVGSDQIWAINQIRGFDPAFFLEFASQTPRIRKLAYAASCGEMTAVADPQHEQRIRDALRTFHAIAVRDENTGDLVRRVSGQQAVDVLDPTFLADFSELYQPVALDRYLLVYAELLPQVQQAIVEYARQHDLRIVSVGYRFRGADKTYPFAHPRQWLSLIRNATKVITNFYHGGIFSILNRRDFVFLGRSTKVIKTQSLLNRLSLTDRWLDQESLTTQQLLDHPSTNYSDDVERAIANGSAESRQFLQQSLE